MLQHGLTALTYKYLALIEERGVSIIRKLTEKRLCTSLPLVLKSFRTQQAVPENDPGHIQDNPWLSN